MIVGDWTKDTLILQVFELKQIKKTYKYYNEYVKATETEEFQVSNDPRSHQRLPESRWEMGRVVVSSDGAVSPTLASRAVLMGM